MEYEYIKNGILKDVFGMNILDQKKIEEMIMKNFSELEQNFEDLKIVYLDSQLYLSVINVLQEEFNSMYNKLSSKVINSVARQFFGMSIEAVIATQSQDKIKMVFNNFYIKMGFSIDFRNKIDSDLEEIANKLNKRFSFDDAALINLIEASRGKNIQLEEDIIRRSNRGRRVILKQNKGSDDYHFSELPNIRTEGMTEEEVQEKRNNQLKQFTHGGDIPDSYSPEGRLEFNKIMLRNYPGFNLEQNMTNKHDIMKKLIGNLLDNLSLCYETYHKYYIDETSKAKEIQATLSDDSKFYFKYIIDLSNLPHILGIPKACNLSAKVRNELGKDGNPLSENASAIEVLMAIKNHRNEIIEAGGLIEENGKTYQMLPWEKIVLKTTSFMRGDFFKTCFCLIELEKGKYLAKENEEYASLASTRYSDDLRNRDLTAYDVLSDLLRTRKQSKDFIASGFVPQYNNSDIYVPDTIFTGKAENIIVGKGNEAQRLMTLQRLRNILGSDSGAISGPSGKIVQRIVSEDGYIKTYSPEEQAVQHLNIAHSFGGNIHVSEETAAFELSIKDEIEQIMKIGLEEILTTKNTKRIK